MRLKFNKTLLDAWKEYSDGEHIVCSDGLLYLTEAERQNTTNITIHNVKPLNVTLYTVSVFATTAANPDESSYACYEDSLRQTYLGDLYSVNWMEDSDAEDIKTETLQKQFSIVRQETNLSHVMEYGDLVSITNNKTLFRQK